MENNRQGQPQQKKGRWNIIMILIIALVVGLLIHSLTSGGGAISINYTGFERIIGVRDADGNYLEVGNPDRFAGNQIHAVVQQGNNFFFLERAGAIEGGREITTELVDRFLSNPGGNARWVMWHQNWTAVDELLQEASSEVNIIRGSRSVPASMWDRIIPFLYIGATIFIAIIILRAFAGRGGISNMGRNRATVVFNSPIRFNDVAGIEEEKAEVEEIVDFLRNPRKYLDLGARIPKGFLLIGSPGTGKTLLAKAIAGEAGVPFFSISGSDFSEMLVGVGPSRMRDLFEQAKANAPCIIFIDEIDSIARMRGVGISGAAEENEQTLNQLLVQMDGFTKSEGVIVLAATNRPDVLDQALLRPGRFDRQIVVQIPDVSGREKILLVHSKNKPIASDVDLKRVSQIISGFSGADIENLMNESAIIAAKKSRRKITMADITEGINKVLLGPQKRSRIITDEDKKITAFHEAGHAVVAKILQPKHTVQEISIIPRGMAAGYTLTNDKDDVTAHKSKTYLKTQLAVFMGGRAAEQMFIGDMCTGAQQDLKHSTGLAERMVTQFGMSDKLGPVFLGRSDEALLRVYDNRQLSDKMQEVVDAEIKGMLVEAETSAKKVLKDHEKAVKVMVDVLLERETIYAEDIDLIMAGKSKDAVIKSIEERLEAARQAEIRERVESDMETLNRELTRIWDMAQTFVQANIITEEQAEKLKKNFDIARTIVSAGDILEHIPTLDNIENYATLVKYQPKPSAPITPTAAEGKEEKTKSSSPSVGAISNRPQAQHPKKENNDENA